MNLRAKKKTGPPRAERFALCLAPGARRTLIVLCSASPMGIVSVRRAAVRGNEADGEAQGRVLLAAQMWRTAHLEAPVNVLVAAHSGTGTEDLRSRLKTSCGPFTDVACFELDGRHTPGTWGTAVCGAANALGLTLDIDTDRDAVMWLAKDAEARATGND